VIQYTTDDWVNTHAFTPRPITTEELTYIFDFNSISGIDDAQTARIKFFAYSGGTGNLRLDTITFKGDCINPGDTPTPTLTATPSPVRSVIISEVAWMGTLASPDFEWIELHNTTSSPISLDGWTLSAADGTPSFSITGTIPANDYFLLRNANVFSSDVSTLSYLYSGSLSDSGESLTLRDASNTVIDTANGNGGAWPAGTLTTAVKHGTMERFGANADSDSQWYTSTGNWTKHDIAGNLIHGTPGGGNSLTPTPTNTVSPTITLSPTLTPTQAPLKTVVITEVGWMGTSSTTTTDEWIELYNNTNAPVDLNGWHLRSYQYNATTKEFVLNLDLTLSGTISVRTGIDDPNDTHGYFLLERRAEAVNDPLYPIDGLVYGGSKYLSNSGEILLLCSTYNIDSNTCSINKKGQVVDFVNASLTSTGGINPWPAGSTSNYGSMERKYLQSDEDIYWFTHTGASPHYGKDANGNMIKGTPGHPNWAFNVTATPRPTATSTPTRTPLALPGPVLVLNEFLARAGTDWNNDGKVDVYDEFIEVINAGIVNVNLSGYKLDDYELDASGKVISNGFALPSMTLKPGEKAVFYGSQTGIRLDDSGDTVRLLRSNNAVLDAVTYPPVKSLDVSVCRYTDGYGSWISGCFPTPGQPNALLGAEVPSSSGKPVSYCFLPDTAPEEFVLAECDESGLGVWNRSYWDSFPGEGEQIWRSDELDKWLVIYQ
jgi:hypothetical protein